MSETAALQMDRDETSELADELAEAKPWIPDAVASSIRETRYADAEVQETEAVGQTESSSAVTVATRTTQFARSRVASFTALQEWDGYVLSVDENSFSARLTDITAGGLPDAEEVDIPFDELDDASVGRLEPGTLFRWSIGYERSPAGQKSRVSRIIVRQLPRWRKAQIEEANCEAAELIQAIDWRG